MNEGDVACGHPRVSVIVPIHNAAGFLRETLEPIVSQSLADIEIILVDDQSTDSSLEICLEHSQADRRVKAVSNTSNRHGVSAARNCGIKVASGKYLAFVDHDDRVDPDMYSRMLGAVEVADADFVDCSYLTRLPNGAVRKSSNSHPKNVRLDREYLLASVVPPLVGTKSDRSLFIGNTVWNKLFRAEIVKGNSIGFDESRMKFEDRLFVVEFLHKANSGVFIDDALYTWVKRPGSLLSRYNPEESRAVIENQGRYRQLFGSVCDFDSQEAITYRLSAIVDVAWSILTREEKSSRRIKIIDLLGELEVKKWFLESEPSLRHPALSLCRSAIGSGRLDLAYMAIRLHLTRRSIRRFVASVVNAFAGPHGSYDVTAEQITTQSGSSQLRV